ncbi:MULTISPECIES: sugar kinase [Halomicrobium]|uniref:PfkB domain protein n=2 Tax=Halomicrobium mukohataei TaxID=57705 RepID=C7NXS6_HALMD|nr:MULTISPECIES: sugar kinase [Halomicrobium]ACV46514.1 PfkB domain protein [Halomicrobium mukohataei DSM 12286]QCD65059.1 sugar kinase [Halomicrobium mukohataei]QFR19865.1 sugar kinase [Halomicrobium sp. ZPS1]
MSRLVTFGETSLRLSPPDHERLETATDVSLHADGTESSTAVAATRLGAPAVWLSKLPDTVLGRRVVAELEQQGDGLQTQVVWDEDGRQGLQFVERGSPPRDDVTVQDRGDTALATVSTDDVRMAMVQNADVFFVSGSTPALSPTARRTTEALYRACEGTCVFDLDYQSGLWSLSDAREALLSLQDAIDVLVADEDDAQAVFDRSGKARQLAHSIASEGDFEQVVITRSERGAVAWDDNVVHEQDAIETEVIDASGTHAGFLGGYLHQLYEDAPTEQALAYGTAAAALTRTVPGPLPTISAGEVEGLVETEREPTGERSI